MPFGRREAFIALALLTLSIPLQYVFNKTDSETGALVRTVTFLRSCVLYGQELLDRLDEFADSMEGVTPGAEGEDGPKMSIGLRNKDGKFANATLGEEFFATSEKPRRKRTKEILYVVGQ